MKALLILFFTGLAIMVSNVATAPAKGLVFHYLLAGFGWFLYLVGKLWYFRDHYDTNNDGLDGREVKRYLQKDWISFLFNAMLLAIVVPYAPEIWTFIMQLAGKEYPFREFVYVLAGGFILVVQIAIDVVKSKLKK